MSGEDRVVDLMAALEESVQAAREARDRKVARDRQAETTLPVVLSDDDRRRLERLTKRKAKADAEWREAVRQAVEGGASLREVGEAAGISHTAAKIIARGR